MTKWWAICDPSGRHEFVKAKGKPRAREGCRVEELPRRPGPFERWVDGKLVDQPEERQRAAEECGAARPGRRRLVTNARRLARKDVIDALLRHNRIDKKTHGEILKEWGQDDAGNT